MIGYNKRPLVFETSGLLFYNSWLLMLAGLWCHWPSAMTHFSFLRLEIVCVGSCCVRIIRGLCSGLIKPIFSLNVK